MVSCVVLCTYLKKKKKGRAASEELVSQDLCHFKMASSVALANSVESTLTPPLQRFIQREFDCKGEKRKSWAYSAQLDYV